MRCGDGLAGEAECGGLFFEGFTRRASLVGLGLNASFPSWNFWVSAKVTQMN
jgi:hypothetical protein